MADDRDGPPDGGIRRRRPVPAAHDSRPFDNWLNRQLHALYDDIAREPLPADVVSLIERHGRDAVATEPPPDTAGPPPPADTVRRDKA